MFGDLKNCLAKRAGAVALALACGFQMLPVPAYSAPLAGSEASQESDDAAAVAGESGTAEGEAASTGREAPEGSQPTAPATDASEAARAGGSGSSEADADSYAEIDARMMERSAEPSFSEDLLRDAVNASAATMPVCPANHGFYTIGSGVGEIHEIGTGNPNALSDNKWHGNIEWRDRNVSTVNLGHDALGIARDGTMWHTEFDGATTPGANPKTWIMHGRMDRVGKGGYTPIEGFELQHPQMPINGGTVDPQGRYLMVGDAQKKGANRKPYEAKLKLLAYDPTSRQVIRLGYISDPGQVSSTVFSDMFFDAQGNFYILSMAQEGTTHRGGNTTTRMKVYRLTAQQYEQALQNGRRFNAGATVGHPKRKGVRVPQFNINENIDQVPALNPVLVGSVDAVTPRFTPAGGAAPVRGGKIYISGFFSGPGGDRGVIYSLDLTTGKFANGGNPVFTSPAPSAFAAGADKNNWKWGDSKIVDLEGCPQSVSTLAVQKNIEKRIDARDQFTVTVRDAQGAAGLTPEGLRTSVTTSGTSTTSGESTAILRQDGRTYVVEEKMAAGSASKLEDYEPVVQCSHANGSTFDVLGGEIKDGVFSAQFVAPETSGQLTCTVTNKPAVKTKPVTFLKYDADAWSPAQSGDINVPNSARLKDVTLRVCADENADSKCDGAFVPVRQNAPVDSAKTDQRGEATWEALEVGKTYLVQETPLWGYRAPEKPLRFQVAEDTKTVLVANHRKPRTVTWEKTDSSDRHLAGSEWKLELVSGGANGATGTNGGDPMAGLDAIADCEATSATECTGSDKDPRGGFFRVENLPWGSYKLSEKKAPAGYRLTDESKYFVADAKYYLDDRAKNQFAAITLGGIINYRQEGPALPLTGGLGEDIFRYGGGATLLAATALGASLWLRKQRRRRSAIV